MKQYQIFMTLLFGLLCSSTVLSKNIFVNHSASGSDNGSSWANAFPTIEQAIVAAEANDVIWVAQGTYRPGNAKNSRYRMKNNVHLFGGFTGVEDRIEQANPFENLTIISGEIGDPNDQTDNIELLMEFRNVGNAIIQGFHFRDAYTTDFIGAIRIDGSSPNFRFCTFEENTANGGFSSGGAITIMGFDGPSEPLFISCQFLNNFCSVIGGAVHSNNNNCRTIFMSCLFAGNEAERGGAIHNGGGEVITFNSTFSQNTANLGSASFTTGSNGTAHQNDIIWGNNHNLGSSATARSNQNAILQHSYSIVEGGATGVENRNVNPLFVDASNGDFSLQENSPARLNGNPNLDVEIFPALDAAGNRRITYGRIDLGAFEFKCLATDVDETNLTISSCESYTSGAGITYEESGNYSEVYANQNGCDSIVNINLTIINLDPSVNAADESLTANAEGVFYQWLDCNDNNRPIDGATDQSFSPEVSGSYAVRISDGDCEAVSECVEININTTSLMGEYSGKQEWNFYPNPAKDFFNLELNARSLVNITNLQGKVVQHMNLAAGKHQVALAHLKPGIYFILINDRRAKLVVH